MTDINGTYEFDFDHLWKFTDRLTIPMTLTVVVDTVDSPKWHIIEVFHGEQAMSERLNQEQFDALCNEIDSIYGGDIAVDINERKCGHADYIRDLENERRIDAARGL